MGTFDVSILNLDNGVYEVVATSGDAHLGGEDLDNNLMEYCIKEFKRQTKMDISENDKAKNRLKKACEIAKRTLSASASAVIEIDSLFNGQDCSISITRSKFEDLCSSFFRKCLSFVEDALRDGKFAKNQIDEVVLVGGSSRIPKLQDMLSRYFNKVLCCSVNPDEAVAVGASIMANALTGGTANTDLLLLDVCPLNLGIETAGEIMTIMIAKNTTIPAEKKQTFSTYQDNQPGASIVILEGLRKFSKDCNKIGEFQLEGIPPQPRGTPQIEVTYSLDANCILTVTACEKSSGINKKLEVKGTSNNLSKDEIDKMVLDAEQYENEDKQRFEQVESKNNFEAYLYQVKGMLGDEKVKLDEKDKSNVSAKLEELQTWMDDNRNADKTEFENKKTELESLVMPLMSKMYGAVPEEDKDSVSQESTASGPKIDEVD